MTDSKIISQFSERFRTSAALAAQARESLAHGVSSGLRAMFPFPIYGARAKGAYKWTADGHRLVDFWMGHSALIFGHAHPRIQQAAVEQLERGTHFAAPHEKEIELARRVVQMVPGVERVRFTGTGSEAVLLALRVARAHTGKTRYLKFEGNYHGWHDALLPGTLPPYDNVPSLGLAPHTQTEAVPVPTGDMAAMEQALADHDDIAAIIVEPGGGFGGSLPHDGAFLNALRKAADQHGAVLIFDEMVTGFRLAPGGASEYFGVKPDLATYGKVLFGGFPGGALAGRADLMALLGDGKARPTVAHQGTWNGAPVSVAAGAAALEMLADGSVHKELEDKAAELRSGLEGAMQRRGVPGRVYGVASLTHVCFGDCPLDGAGRLTGPGAARRLHMTRLNPEVNVMLRCALLNRGVDFFTAHASTVSTAHRPEHLAQTIEAFEGALGDLQAEKILP